MNIILHQGSSFGLNGLTSSFRQGMKSTRQKQQRQAERDSQVAFFEKQKENLKNMKCDSIEDIKDKLDMFHSYENRIAAVKEQYNYSQMRHILDEAEEWGEKAAKAAEKYEPKTAEERREEAIEEALGTDESKGMSDELFEELIPDELTEDILKIPEQTTDELTTEAASDITEISGPITEITAKKIDFYA